MTEPACRIGLVVRSAPFAGRSGRDQLDLALSAMTLGFDVELFFIGAGVLQLLPDAEPESAGLPPGILGWASLPELGPVQAWAAAEQRKDTGALPAGLALPVDFAPSTELAARLDACDHVLVI